jgi:uncharacterized membrane protein YbhN (UPF0104 family)
MSDTVIAHRVKDAGIISWITCPAAFAVAWEAMMFSPAEPGGYGISNTTTIRGCRPGCFL